MNRGTQACALTYQAIAQGNLVELEGALAEASEPEISPEAKVLSTKLQAILRGDRDPALAADPELDYADAVELQLLLEALGAS